VTDEKIKKKRGQDPDTLLVLAAFQAPSEDAAIFPVLNVIDEVAESGGEELHDDRKQGNTEHGTTKASDESP